MQKTGGVLVSLVFCYSKIPLIGKLNNKHSFLIVLEAGKAKVKEQAEPVSGEGSLPGLQMTAFLPCLHIAERDKESSVSFSSYKGMNPDMGLHHYDLI